MPDHQHYQDTIEQRLARILPNDSGDYTADEYELAREVKRLQDETAKFQRSFDGHVYVTNEEYAKLTSDVKRLQQQLDQKTAEVDVIRGTACAEGIAEGDGPCGICLTCKDGKIKMLTNLLGEAENHIASFYVDWAALSQGSPDYDANYKPEYPPLVHKLRTAIRGEMVDSEELQGLYGELRRIADHLTAIGGGLLAAKRDLLGIPHNGPCDMCEKLTDRRDIVMKTWRCETCIPL